MLAVFACTNRCRMSLNGVNLCRLGMIGSGDGAGFHNWFWLGTGALAAQVELITAMTRL